MTDREILIKVNEHIVAESRRVNREGENFDKEESAQMVGKLEGFQEIVNIIKREVQIQKSGRTLVVCGTIKKTEMGTEKRTLKVGDIR